MPVTQRGSSWQAAVSHKGRRFRRDFPTKAEAMQWEADAKASLLRGEMPDLEGAKAGAGRAMTMSDLLDYTTRHVWAGAKAERTLVRNGNTVVNTLGADTPVVKITVESIDKAVVRWQHEGNSGATINRKLAALSKMLTEAQRAGVIPSKPYIRRRKESEHRLRWFSEQEESEMLAYWRTVGNTDMHDLTIIGIDTGLRLSEMLGLTRRDIQGDWIRLDGARTKSGTVRGVPMTKRVKSLITDRLEEHGLNVFPKLTVNRAEHAWKGLRAHMGAEEDTQFVIHVLRHTFCSRLVQRGVPILEVQKLAGHSTLAMTMRYAKLAPQNLVNAIAMLETQEAAE